MATITQYLAPEEASFLPAAGFPAYTATPGTAFTVTGLAYDGGTAIEEAAWKFDPVGYGSGDLTVDIVWYADSGTTGSVQWWASVAAITPNTDSQDVETKTFSGSASVIDTHLGTTAQRLHKATITLPSANLGGMAAGDEVWIRIFRIPSGGSDTMTADAIVTSIRLSYSDT